jgi:hypothetical protein
LRRAHAAVEQRVAVLRQASAGSAEGADQ